MKCEATKLQLLDLLYEELEEQTAAEVRMHLDACEHCRVEFDTLRSTRQMLRLLPQEEPEERLVFAAPPRSFAAWLNQARELLPRPAWARLALSTLAVAALLLVIGSLANLRVQYGSSGVQISMSLLPAESQGLSPEAVEAILARARAENAEYTARLLAEQQQRQNEEWNAMLTKFALEYERKREADLHLLGSQLEQLNESSNEYFRQLMRTVNYPRR